MSEIDKLRALCNGARAISPGLEVKIVASDREPERWCVTIGASSVVLVWTEYAPLEDALDQALRKLASISHRTLAAVTPPDE